jgi:hypothetical protein
MYGQIPAYLNRARDYLPARPVVFEMVVVPGSGSFSGGVRRTPYSRSPAAAPKTFYPDKRARLIAQEVSLGPSPEPHLHAIRQYIEAGFDHLILTQIGSEQDPFVEFFKRERRHTILS